MEISTYAGCLSMLRSAAIRQLRMFQRITMRWHPSDDLLLKTSWVALVPLSLSYLELLYIYIHISILIAIPYIDILGTESVEKHCNWGYCWWSSYLCGFWRRFQDWRIHLASSVLCAFDERLMRRFMGCLVDRLSVGCWLVIGRFAGLLQFSNGIVSKPCTAGDPQNSW